jgi:putative transposase
MAANRCWLTVERFPAYAPELNPAEYLWAALKAKDAANYCPPATPDLDRRIRQGVRRLRRHPTLLAGCPRASGLFTKRR